MKHQLTHVNNRFPIDPLDLLCLIIFLTLCLMGLLMKGKMK